MLKAISLFTGVGGLDFGFEAAGFETQVAVELDPTACRTIRENRSWPVLEGDIHSFTSRTIAFEAGLKPGETDVLIGGPPCQPFSKSGYWVHGDAKRLDDPRADTLTAYLRVLRDLQPKAFLLENVHGLVYRGKDEGLRHLLAGIESINELTNCRYKVSYQVIRMAEFGVPQLRERVFVIGSREGTKFEFPRPTHADPDSRALDGTDLLPFNTAWDAIGDLADEDDPSLDVKGYWGGLLPSIPEGQNYLWHTNRGGGRRLFGWRTRFWSFLLKLAKSRPSWTIQAQPGSAIGPFHWKNRRLSTRELCRLMTFPDNVRFDCGRTEVQRMAGNAVPSLMAEILAWEIRTQLLDGVRPVHYQLMPSKRRPVPAPEPIQDVPPQYLHHEAEHADHPGEGKGKGSRQMRLQEPLSQETLL